MARQAPPKPEHCASCLPDRANVRLLRKSCLDEIRKKEAFYLKDLASKVIRPKRSEAPRHLGKKV
jgi:hypothetical protein